jgi:large subunit ribosomal protein L6
MSRIGLKPITLPTGTSLEITDGGEFGYKIVTVKGPKGELAQSLRAGIDCEIKDGVVNVTRSADTKELASQHGLYRSIISNMVIGVSEGYVKELHIEGIGYRANMSGNGIELALGYSHKILATPPAGVSVEVADQTEIKITGIDKQKVGEFAAKIRSYRKPEPYKGKGIRYKDEQIKKKDVKSAK